MHRLFPILTVALFLIFLCTPPLITLLTPDQEISKTEKRKLASLPNLGSTSDQLVEFPAKFEEYYNDHFGLRNLLVFYQQLFSYRTFQVSSSPLVTVGEDNWLFFNGERAMDAYLGLTPISQGHLELYRWALIDRRNWLAENGISYIFVPVPNKESVYPEHLPRRIRKNAGISFYDQVIGYLNTPPGFPEYIDVKETLLHQKIDNRLFLKTDSHWNVAGAFAAYTDIGTMVKALNIPMRLLQEEDIDWEAVSFSGDLATLLHLHDILTETAPEIKGIPSCTKSLASVKDSKPLGTPPFRTFSNDPRKFTRVQECTENKTSALVIYDSFGEFLRPFLNASFGTVYYSNRDFNQIKDFVEAVQPDVIIDQRVERNLSNAMLSDLGIENETVSRHFPQAEHTLLQIDSGSNAEEFGVSAGAVVQLVKDGLQIRSATQFPALGLRYDSGESGGAVMVRVRLSSKQDTQCLLYYTTKDNPEFIPMHTRTFEVKKGYNEFYFRLPGTGGERKLQFHPGTIAGEYLLHSFVIKKQ